MGPPTQSHPSGHHARSLDIARGRVHGGPGPAKRPQHFFPPRSRSSQNQDDGPAVGLVGPWRSDTPTGKADGIVHVLQDFDEE